MLNLMGSFAEFEREIMLERQREGVAKAGAEGKYRGLAPTVQRKASEVIQLQGQGYGLSISQRSSGSAAHQYSASSGISRPKRAERSKGAARASWSQRHDENSKAGVGEPTDHGRSRPETN
jgi:DNA invertase Pin-like site-specific DNA recombinase